MGHLDILYWIRVLKTEVKFRGQRVHSGSSSWQGSLSGPFQMESWVPHWLQLPWLWPISKLTLYFPIAPVSS